LELFPDFTKEDFTASLALINRRNEELHSGAAAFEAYRSGQWLSGVYRACQALSAAMGESLTSLFGEEEAKLATAILAENQQDTRQRVQRRIASHSAVFEEKEAKERVKAQKEAEKSGESLAHEGHHRVSCPACKSVGTLRGRAFGKEHVADEDGDIVVRQAVVPASFSCSACGLKLEGYAEMEAAGLGGNYTRRTTYAPDQYYGLIHPDDLQEHIEKYLADEMQEYDNE